MGFKNPHRTHNKWLGLCFVWEQPRCHLRFSTALNGGFLPNPFENIDLHDLDGICRGEGSLESLGQKGAPVVVECDEVPAALLHCQTALSRQNSTLAILR